MTAQFMHTEEERLARALSLIVQQKTISGGSLAPFKRMHALIRELFPHIFSVAEVNEVKEGALLIKISGERIAKPLVFLSHMDVVDAMNAEQWKFPPFSGITEDGFVWGRGTSDMKGHMTALLFAADSLLQTGWQPKGDIWFAFSCDEEIRGSSMKEMCAILQGQGVKPAFVLDEGGAVTRIGGAHDEPAAYVGVAEKGRLLFDLTSESEPAMESLTAAAARIARIHIPPSLCSATMMTLRSLQDGMRPFRRFCVSHSGAFGGILLHELSETAYGRAITHTQISLCKMSGNALTGETPVLSYQASVLPGDSTEELLARIRRMIADESVRMNVSVCDEPSATSPAQGPAWEALHTAIQVNFPHTQIAPCLLAGGSDARRMEPLCQYVYRFSPFVMPPEELARIHSRDERMSLQNLIRGMNFFKQMLQA